MTSVIMIMSLIFNVLFIAKLRTQFAEYRSLHKYLERRNELIVKLEKEISSDKSAQEKFMADCVAKLTKEGKVNSTRLDVIKDVLDGVYDD